MTLTAAEQYGLELINRARLDPAAEAARLGIDLNDGLAPGTISTAAKQVLAPNALLEASSQAHSEWLLATDVFSHTGAGGSSAGDRIVAAGYKLAGSWGWAENLASAMTTGALDLEAAITQHHDGLFRSAGHRTNTLDGRMREIGIAQVEGQFTQGGVTYNASMLTQNFTFAGTAAFVTGVVYSDADADAFYGIGEGLAGMTVIAAGAASASLSAGGYSVAVAPSAAVAVSVQSGGTAMAELSMDVSGGNGKLDVVLGADGLWRLELSASATLVSGVGNATLLGVADLNLTGHGGANLLTGNKGANSLSGADGNDTLRGADGNDGLSGGAGVDRLEGGNGADHLIGGAGNDVLTGGADNDVLDGGAGRDRLSAGAGADVFVFRSTSDSGIGASRRDQIDAFERGLDRIDLSEIDANLAIAGDQAFHYIGSAGFAGLGAASAGELRASGLPGGKGLVLELDVNGDALADMQIQIKGAGSLSASDFIL